MRIRLESATVSYGARQVLTSVSIELTGPGSYAVMGPSGAGKSTLLSLIAGELTPQSGRVIIEGLDSHRIDWLVQSTPLLTRRTAVDNVALGPLSVGHRRRESIALAHRALSRLQIDHLAASPTHRLSGGERQRIAVARCLATGPGLVLADEPTASLDADARERVCEALAELSAAGSLVVIATHDPYVAASCDDTLDLERRTLTMRIRVD